MITGFGAMAAGSVDAALDRALALGAGRVVICGWLTSPPA
jgi:dihydrofolate synthase/folylpolyglutamate synthase